MMRACTLWNPWAWAVISAGKDVENRPRSLGYVGEVAIHVGLNWDVSRVKEDLLYVSDAMKACGHPSGGVVRDNPITMGAMLHRQRGHVIGVVEIVRWLPLHRVSSPWAFGPWCAVLRNPRPITEPIRVRGYQGVWTLSDDVERRVREQLEAPSGRT